MYTGLGMHDLNDEERFNISPAMKSCTYNNMFWVAARLRSLTGQSTVMELTWNHF